MIRWLTAPALLLTFLIGQTPTAYACDCSALPLDTSIAQADMVVRATVTRMETTETAAVLRLTASVSETFKGTTTTTVTIYTHPFGASCLEYDFRAGREYVVFARINNGMLNGRKSNVLQMRDVPATAYVVYLCGGTADVARGDGHERLAAVRQRLKLK